MGKQLVIKNTNYAINALYNSNNKIILDPADFIHGKSCEKKFLTNDAAANFHNISPIYEILPGSKKFIIRGAASTRARENTAFAVCVFFGSEDSDILYGRTHYHKKELQYQNAITINFTKEKVSHNDLYYSSLNNTFDETTLNYSSYNSLSTNPLCTHFRIALASQTVINNVYSNLSLNYVPFEKGDITVEFLFD